MPIFNLFQYGIDAYQGLGFFRNAKKTCSLQTISNIVNKHIYKRSMPTDD